MTWTWHVMILPGHISTKIIDILMIFATRCRYYCRILVSSSYLGQAGTAKQSRAIYQALITRIVRARIISLWKAGLQLAAAPTKPKQNTPAIKFEGFPWLAKEFGSFYCDFVP